jgi:hypothetical protein
VFYYYAYGLNIGSELRLPELLTTEADCDIAIHLDPNARELSQIPAMSGWLKLTRQEAILSIEKVGSFQVRSGRDVIVTVEPAVDESLIRLYLLGVVMGVLLFQRGKLVLHASSVEIDGCAVAFLGNSGWGKSSIAAALHARGHGIVTDDVTAVNLGAGCATVFPGVPLLKVNADVSLTLGIDPKSLVFLHSAEIKRGLHVTQCNPTVPVPLARIYVLAHEGDLKIKPLLPQESMIELVRHSYPTRLLQRGDAIHFQQCAQLAREVPIFSLSRAESLSSLPELACLVDGTMLDKYM